MRRAGVMDATGKLQRDGLISYGNGRVTVLDRPKLQYRVCECYGALKHEIERLFAFDLPAQTRVKLKPVS